MTTNTSPQCNTQATATSATTEKPTYMPDHWELKHGKISKDGVFCKPNFVVMRNGKYIELHGSTVSAYSYKEAFHIMLHLQAVSDDVFTVEPMSWQPMTDYNVILEEGEVKQR